MREGEGGRGQTPGNHNHSPHVHIYSSSGELSEIIFWQEVELFACY